MAKNQKTLENQYHMVVARCKDLEEQMRIRQKQWDQREVESKTTEKLMRELCEDILAKDSKEMVLGTDYSWSSIQINELYCFTHGFHAKTCRSAGRTPIGD